MNVRKIAAALAAFGLMTGLVGVGISATYTDSATAVVNANVGTFGCTVSSTDPSAVVVPAVPGGPDTSVILTVPAIQASGSTSVFLTDVTVHNIGSMPMHVHWTFATAGTIDWQPHGRIGYYTGTGNPGDPGNMQTDIQLAPGASKTYTYFGFGWAELTNADLGTSGSVTATANCSEPPAGPTTSGIQYIAGASADSNSVTIPAACQPGDLAVAVAFNASTTYKSIDNGFTTYTHYYYSGAGIGDQVAYKTLVSGDAVVSTPTGTGAPFAIGVACYRHAAMASNQPGSVFWEVGANGAASTSAACYSPAYTFGSGNLPIDGSAAVVCIDGTTATGTNLQSMFSPPVTPATGGSVKNRSAGYASAKVGIADTVDSAITSWAAPGTVLANWTQNVSSNHSTESFGLVYAP